MRQAVLDANVLISALLSPSGAPARILVAWRDGAFDLVVSPMLLEELARALAYPKLRDRIPASDAQAFVVWLQEHAVVVPDPITPAPVISVDPDDDYLLALAAEQSATLVSGDRHLLAFSDSLPVMTAAAFAAEIA